MTSKKYKKLLMAEGLDRNLAEYERKRLATIGLFMDTEERKNCYKRTAAVQKEDGLCSLRAMNAAKARYL